MEDEIINECKFIDCPDEITYECSKEIIEQMAKYICKIKIGNNHFTGFFCKIPFPDKNHLLPVLITDDRNINGELLYRFPNFTYGYLKIKSVIIFVNEV